MGLLTKARGDLPVFIDIDGTLTADGSKRGGEPLPSRINAVRKMIDQGSDVVLWSYAGGEYAAEFAVAHGIEAIATIGKPRLVIDDNPDIVPMGMNIRHPKYLDSE